VSAPAITYVLAPIDQGVRNVGGRDGTREGPQRLLAALEEAGLVPKTARVREPAIDNEPASLEADLEALSTAVCEELEADRLPVVLGGDHGTTYATVRGAARALTDVGVAYLDVHLDVRAFEPEHTSGSSFRRLIEEGWVDAEHARPLGPRTPTGRRARRLPSPSWQPGPTSRASGAPRSTRCVSAAPSSSSRR
jgi:arginase family enzyme